MCRTKIIISNELGFILETSVFLYLFVPVKIYDEKKFYKIGPRGLFECDKLIFTAQMAFQVSMILKHFTLSSLMLRQQTE